MSKPKVLLVGVSGPSCSGKTTLARLLRDIWPSSFILHEDDFYWTDKKIPVKEGIQDWDCLESIGIATFRQSLEYIKDHGTLPTELKSKEDQNSVGESGVDQRTIEDWKQNYAVQAIKDCGLRIAICDGFLLYSQQMKEIWELLDVKIFLRAEYDASSFYLALTQAFFSFDHLHCKPLHGSVDTFSYATVKGRREARSGYVTLEGFWEDPPGYVDKIVWPNYVKDHAFLFRDGDVEGELNQDVSAAMKLEVMPKEHGNNMTQCLQWACGVLQKAVGHLLEA